MNSLLYILIVCGVFFLTLGSASGEISEKVKINIKQLKNTKDCQGCDLTGINLYKINLSNANLKNANLKNARFHGTNLNGADMRGVNLSGSRFNEVNMKKTNLSGANLSNATLIYVQLKKANLIGVNLSNAALSYVNLSKVDLSNTILTGVKTDKNKYIIAEIRKREKHTEQIQRRQRVIKNREVLSNWTKKLKKNTKNKLGGLLEGIFKPYENCDSRGSIAKVKEILPNVPAIRMFLFGADLTVFEINGIKTNKKEKNKKLCSAVAKTSHGEYPIDYDITEKGDDYWIQVNLNSDFFSN